MSLYGAPFARPQMHSAQSKRLRLLRGFTLIELLVVIAIIALLLSILVPSLSEVRKSAQTLKCQTNLYGIGRAVALCQEENNGFNPNWDDAASSEVINRPFVWTDVLFDRDFLPDDKQTLCPSDDNPTRQEELLAQNVYGNLQFLPNNDFGLLGESGLRSGMRGSYALNSNFHFQFPADRHPQAANQIFAVDGNWSWFSSLNASFVFFEDYFGIPGNIAFPTQGANNAAWRHGRNFETTMLMADFHVQSYRPLRPREGLSNVAFLDATTDSSRVFTWKPGEATWRPAGAAYQSLQGGGGDFSGAPGLIDTYPQWRTELAKGNGKFILPGEAGQTYTATGGAITNPPNFHPSGFPDELSSVWLTDNDQWRRLPNDHEDRDGIAN